MAIFKALARECLGRTGVRPESDEFTVPCTFKFEEGIGEIGCGEFL